MNTKQKVRCSICGEDYDGTQHFAQISISKGKPKYICEDCIVEMAVAVGLGKKGFEYKNKNIQAVENIRWNKSMTEDASSYLDFKQTSPKKIKEYLDQYIIGQEIPKKIISVAYYNHLKRIRFKKPLIKKSNILLVGPTGSGKTLIAQKLAELSNLPFVTVDATTLTKKGYAGEDVDSIIYNLYIKAHQNKELTEKGIVYIDECDKLSAKNIGTETNYIGGQSVQQGLLKIIEGTEVNITTDTVVTINTSNILFICGGAFAELTQKEQKKNLSIGFGQKQNTENDKVLEAEDFIKFGIIPELIGRLPVIATLNKLTKEELIKILHEPKENICDEYKLLFSMDDINLKFDNDVLEIVADKAIEKDIGARGLRSIMEKILNPLMFEIPKDKKEIVITKNMAKQTLKNIEAKK